MSPTEAQVAQKLRLWSIRDHEIGVEATAGRLAAEQKAREGGAGSTRPPISWRLRAKVITARAKVKRVIKRLTR